MARKIGSVKLFRKSEKAISLPSHYSDATRLVTKRKIFAFWHFKGDLSFICDPVFSLCPVTTAGGPTRQAALSQAMGVAGLEFPLVAVR